MCILLSLVEDVTAKFSNASNQNTIAEIKKYCLIFDDPSLNDPRLSEADFDICESQMHIVYRYVGHSGISNNNIAECIALLYEVRTCLDVRIKPFIWESTKRN